MKNKVLIVLGLIIIGFVIKLFLPQYYFWAGKNAYDKKDYLKAGKYLAKAVKSDKYNKDYRFYYVNTLKNLPKLLDVQKEIYLISTVDIPDSANLIANQYVEEMRTAFRKQATYIDQVTSNGLVFHWNKQPIRVEVKTFNPNIPSYFYRELVNAFRTWQYSTDSDIKFLFNNIAPDIVIDFKTRETNSDAKDYVVAYCEPEYDAKKLQKMKITFYDKNNFMEKYTPTEIYNIALHEIGHALGIMGHSPNPTDIMYMKTNSDNPEMLEYRRNLTEIDIKTLNMLYKICPDVSNASCTDDMIYAPIILGDKYFIGFSKIIEAQNYVQKAPEIPNGYIDLADAYLQLKNYAKAEEALLKAFDLAQSDINDDDTRFVVNYNLAVLYTELQNFDKALEYANNARKYRNNVSSLMAMIYYSSGDYDNAVIEYEKLVQDNPTNIFSSTILANVYIKQNKYKKAARVLHQIVKNNPEAKDNNVVKRYKLLMFFCK